MNIIKGQKQDISNIMDIISKCINNMKALDIKKLDKYIFHKESFLSIVMKKIFTNSIFKFI